MSPIELRNVSRISTTEDIQYRIAATLEERTDAFRLVYDSYLKANLGDTNPYEMRVTPYHLLSTTEVFIAVCNDEVISTVSLVIDGELGLPMESVFAQQVAAKREQGIVSAEVSCLADRRSEFKELFPVFIQLCRLMAHHACARGLDELLVAVHPRHARFYKRFMAFEPIGETSSYPCVHNKPAVPLCLNFDGAARRFPERRNKFFGDPIPEELLRPQPISETDRDYLQMVLDACNPLQPHDEGDYVSTSAKPTVIAA